MSAINGWRTAPVINAMVYWTLPYEWLFYICLPLAAAMLTQPFPVRVLALAWLTLIALSWQIISMYFVLGAVAAWLHDKNAMRASATGWVGAAVSISSLLTFFTYRDTAYDATSAILLFLFFAPIAAGQNFARLLMMKPLRLLGCVSYSLYLFHGIVLYVLGISIGFATNPWLTASAAVILIFILSCLSYRWVEYPFLKH